MGEVNNMYNLEIKFEQIIKISESHGSYLSFILTSNH